VETRTLENLRRLKTRHQRLLSSVTTVQRWNTHLLPFAV
jgi:hypothetical protein